MNKQTDPSHRKLKVLYISPYIPRECGIATYTKNLTDAINILSPENLIKIYAIDNSAGSLPYPKEVLGQIDSSSSTSYLAAARVINHSNFDIVHLQHEFGLYSGDYGEEILLLIRNLKKRFVITFHTVIAKPDDKLKKVVRELSARAFQIIVMAEKAADRLVRFYRVSKNKIVFIPHGVPDIPYRDPKDYKEIHSLSDKLVISTFGLISENKGIEYIIKAMPKILQNVPNAIFLILGKTHPVVIAHDGEKYREKLTDLAATLGVQKEIMFVNKYLYLNDILEYLSLTDIYITAYLEPQQVSSGTLAYALGAGKAIISTPYIYARENLKDGRGFLVPFRDHNKIAEKASILLTDNHLRSEMSQKSYEHGRKMVWSSVAHRHLAVFRSGDTSGILPIEIQSQRFLRK